MNRRNRTLLVLGVAVLLAGLASFGVYQAILQIPVRQVEVATNFTVVAAKSLPVGTLLKKEDIKLIPWPAATPVAGGYRTVEEVVDRGLTSSVVENEPLTSFKVASREGGAGLPPSIPPGMRAMSIKVNDVIGVAGYVLPSSRVDVLVVVKADKDSISRVVVTNLQVVATGTMIDQEAARAGKAVQANTVTLLVTPRDAERIALAQNQGQITLALRNPLDTEVVETNGVRMGSLLGAPDTAPVRQVNPRGQVRMVTPPPPPAPKPYTVEMIRGAKRSEETVK